ncbi:unnamed protein product [Toxocara canis]|uniref:C2H2-type domain-containing protein n=1 Tax=Toxocara canis TaxID=6265 RepID=A0A3P7GBX9_TOXCA|nr:unnamed protein product [Toxocara canis]
MRGLIEACTPAATSLLPVVPTIEVNLGTLPNAAQAFKIILNFLYSGEFDLESIDPLQVLQVSRLCQIVTAELRLTSMLTQNLLRIQEEKANAQPSLLSLMQTALPASVEIKWLLAMQMLKLQQTVQPFGVGQMQPQQPGTSVPRTSPIVHLVTATTAPSLNAFDECPMREQCDSPDSVITLRSAASGVLVSSHRNSSAKDKTSEVIVPSNDKEGCRKCPFCRHVSKSPAMLEKHITRHIPDCSRDGHHYKCPKCATTADSQREIYEHVLQHQENTLQCDQCNYRGRTSSNLDQHKLFKHSKEMFKEKLECVECNFKCISGDGLLYHYERMHRASAASEDELQENGSDYASTSTNSRKANAYFDDCASSSTIVPHKRNANASDPAENQDEPMCLVIRKSNSP